MIIEDGKGKGTKAAVTGDNRLDVSSRQNKRIFYISRDDGRAFVWISSFTSGGTDVEVLYLKNTSSSRKLYIDSMRYSAAAACIFTVQKHTGTPTGTIITGENLNFTSSNDAESGALGNAAITASSIGNVLAKLQVGANTDGNRNWNGEIILGQGDAIIVTVSANTAINIGVTGFFE